MARRIAALAIAIATGLIGSCAVGSIQGCAWWQTNEPAIADATYLACKAVAAQRCMDPVEAERVCRAAHDIQDATRTLSTKSADICPVTDSGVSE